MTEKEFVEFAHMQMDLLRTEICHMREKRDMALWENAIDAKDLAYWRNQCKRLISEKLNAIRERDEARKQIWENHPRTTLGAREYADARGWAPFMEENDNA
jgi:uncharacterized protein YigA (DUF484 family)